MFEKQGERYASELEMIYKKGVLDGETNADNLIEKMKCCANCKHSEQGEYDEFEDCSRCHAKDCYCRIEQQTRNSAGKYHDWDDKCDKWELKESE